MSASSPILPGNTKTVPMDVTLTVCHVKTHTVSVRLAVQAEDESWFRDNPEDLASYAEQHQADWINSIGLSPDTQVNEAIEVADASPCSRDAAPLQGEAQ